MRANGRPGTLTGLTARGTWMRTFFVTLVLAVFASPGSVRAEDDFIYIRMETSMGDIYLALNETKAPATVDNFLTYARSGYYDRMIFHRVAPGRLVQGGGYNRSLYEREKRDPIVNEADNGLKNLRGAIAMARNDEPDSAQSQFYINTKDNPELDHQGKEYKLEWGYAVFGTVVAGMQVVDAISAVPTEGRKQFEADVPVEHIYISALNQISVEEVPATE